MHTCRLHNFSLPRTVQLTFLLLSTSSADVISAWSAGSCALTNYSNATDIVHGMCAVERLETLDPRRRSGQEEGEIAHATRRAGEFTILLPRSGFYYHRDVTANAGAAFHDMLLSSAHGTDEDDKVRCVHTCTSSYLFVAGFWGNA